MSKIWFVLLMIGIVAANMPAVMAQWHADRAGAIKTLQLFAIYLIYCLIGGGVVIWLAMRARLSGKSMLPRRLPSLLPPLEPAEMLEVSMIRSLAGDLNGGKIGRASPFRSPHHSVSMAALVGGGTRPRPGEVALAHLGVLFLDELPEFHPQVLDALRQPLETGETVIARANHRITYPSRIQLVAAMNPCRCGRADEPGYACRQGRGCVERYQARISGPLLDRVDLQIEVPAVSAADLVLPQAAEGSADVRARVAAARRSKPRASPALGSRVCVPTPNVMGACSRKSQVPSLPASSSCAMPPTRCP
jgi:magnesium chelatase family protein